MKGGPPDPMPRRNRTVSHRERVARKHGLSLKLLDQLEYVRNSGEVGLAESGVGITQRRTLLRLQLIDTRPAVQRYAQPRLFLTEAGKAVLADLRATSDRNEKVEA